MKIEEIRGKTNDELEYELAQLQKELFDRRFKSATETSTNPARIRQLRRAIARVHTVVHERDQVTSGQEPR